MIESATSAAMSRIEARERDVRNAYRPGFVPEANDVRATVGAAPAASALSVAAPAGAYFLSRDSARRMSLTRDGAFAVVDGELRSSDGRPVLGFGTIDATTLGPLQIDRYDLALRRVAAPRVEGDGSFAYERTAIDPRTGERRTERVVAGRLALARLPPGTQPVRVDSTHVAPPKGTNAIVGLPGDAAFGNLLPHARDLGGVDVVTGLEKMREAYAAFDALRAAHHARGALEKTALDLVK